MQQLPLNFDQILNLVKELPENDKLKLSQELEKDTLDHKLTELLQAFQTDVLSLDTINQEVEAVRNELYAQRNPH